MNNNSIDNLLATIKEGRTSHSCSLVGGEYLDVDLSHLRADKLEIENVVLTSANLSVVSWRNCKVTSVCLDKANFDGANMRLCKFVSLSAKRASFENTKMENCNAQGCIFDGAIFIGTSLTDSDFDRASFKDADLSNSDASYCNMRGVDFRGAKLIKTNFRDTDLRGADFSNTVIDDVDFRGADLRGAQFDEAIAQQLLPDAEQTQPPAEIIDAVAPLVASLLNQASKKSDIDENSWLSELDKTLNNFSGSELDSASVASWDKQLGPLLEKAGEVGINNLLDTLRSDEDKPPQAVAKMLEDLALELGLESGSNTEDLLAALLNNLKKTDKRPETK